MSHSTLIGAGRRTDKNSLKTPALIFTIIFSAIILILALVESPQILLVLVLYFCILLDGISISALVLYSINRRTDSLTEFENIQAQQVQRSPRGADVVSSMDVYVTYAVRGSAHSRREVAFVIRNILAGAKGRKVEALEARDPAFASDMRNVVYRYLDESASRENRRESRGEREAYVSSLERVISKIREE